MALQEGGFDRQSLMRTIYPLDPPDICVAVASGRKLNVPGKRVAGSVMSKSQTLPRSMGRSTPTLPCHRTPIKPSGTPPSMKRQLSVPGNGSPIRRPGTPSGTHSNRGTPTRKVPLLKGVDPKLAQVILDEILEGSTAVQWEDIAGQEVHARCILFKWLSDYFGWMAYCANFLDRQAGSSRNGYFTILTAGTLYGTANARSGTPPVRSPRQWKNSPCPCGSDPMQRNIFLHIRRVSYLKVRGRGRKIGTRTIRDSSRAPAFRDIRRRGWLVVERASRQRARGIETIENWISRRIWRVTLQSRWKSPRHGCDKSSPGIGRGSAEKIHEARLCYPARCPHEDNAAYETIGQAQWSIGTRPIGSTGDTHGRLFGKRFDWLGQGRGAWAHQRSVYSQ